MSAVREREEIDRAYRWDLDSVYESEAAWEDAYETVEERIESLADREGEPIDDGEDLLSLLELRDEVSRRVETVTAYARMRSDQDTRDQSAQAMADRGRSLSTRASSAASFVEPAIQSLSRERVEEMIEATDGLERYEHYLDDVLRMKPHTRSAEVEELLSEFSEVLGAPQETYSMLLDADVTFPTVERPDGEAVEITQSNLTTLLKHEDRAFRQRVYEAFYDELDAYRNAVGATLRNSVKTDVKQARARRYETAREAALDGPNVPVDVYDALVDTVREHLDVLHRHVDLKADALGVEEPAMWDLYAPITGTESPTVEYETACEHVVDAVAPLGGDYQDRVAEGLDSRWVDVYENRGKRSGAYSSGTYDTQPFILMNYQDDVSSMFTLAHELGHSIHSQLASEAQPYVYGDYDIFTAEVASTVNEALLTEHLLENADDEALRRHVLDQYLERFRSTLFRQTMFADFEHQIHELAEAGEPLTPDRLDDAYGDLKREFYAPARADDRIDREWMRIPHFYYNYYVYQYSTGLSAAVAVVDRIRQAGRSAAEDYLGALRMGGSDYPLSILDRAGVDMTTPAPVEAAIAEYDDALDEMADLV
ncbi:MAG: oligoendopeptidase F [Halobacteriaceae archaeon]